MDRLLVVGAGATIEECIRSGNLPNDPKSLFPSIKNFCAKFFQPMSSSLFYATASYLIANEIPFDKKFLNMPLDGEKLSHSMQILNIKDGDKVTDEDLANGPIGTFVKMEKENPRIYNIERLCEFAWNSVGADNAFWRDFVYSGIYDKLQWLFYYQFGSGLGKPMLAGTKVANQLDNYDGVINLNYDIAFDLALKQAGKNICYAPHFKENAIYVLKPHGSINLYMNYKTKKWFFAEPDKVAGSVSLDLGNEGIFDPFESIIPPRLNKNYKLHPMAKAILHSIRTYKSNKLTFWGIGLTESDVDLLEIYREASSTAKVVEFINPDESACAKASSLLDREVKWFASLGEWLEQFGVSYP